MEATSRPTTIINHDLYEAFDLEWKDEQNTLRQLAEDEAQAENQTFAVEFVSGVVWLAYRVASTSGGYNIWFFSGDDVTKMPEPVFVPQETVKHIQ